MSAIESIQYAPAEAFLNPEGAILREPEQVERALALLWEKARPVGPDNGGRRSVSRVCVANLIVVAHIQEWNSVSATLGEMSQAYPTRTIVLLIDPEQPADQQSEGIRASVSALCYLSQPDSPQACCDQIILRIGGEAVRNLDRILLSLVESDIPIVAWWLFDPARAPRLFEFVDNNMDRLVLDAGAAGLRHPHPSGRCSIRELGWYRTARWRELLAGMFDEVPQSVIRGIDRVSLIVDGSLLQHRLDALWILGFVGGQLDWRPDRVVEPGKFLFRAGKTMIEADISLSSPGSRNNSDLPAGLVASHCGAGSGIDAMTLAARTDRFEVTRCAQKAYCQFQVVHHDHQSCRLPRYLDARCVRKASALTAAFTGRSVDPVYDRAAPLVTWMSPWIEKTG